jgi:hypothetical protein
LEEPELAQIGDENQTILLKVTEGLRLISQRVEIVIGGFDFNHTPFWVSKNLRFSIAPLTTGLREETSVRHAGALIAELC